MTLEPHDHRQALSLGEAAWNENARDWVQNDEEVSAIKVRVAKP